ncbi:hypothetical protein [Vitiosangium sp. GDMCC 1.1324]|uniref:hypothetical protein n=1 Tax=Vitiosangium sp. (strain GDMCC 1.1324) TaxID=2138576 RepID=UPI000D34D9D6|nr:hypothetical protein [Vitiosangium sp. GDMCC 1.1324]PTL83639.1 hypothetical protein DAT35_09140 [Vitiosangium sp. GDMCC 1.1324]
MRAARSAGAVLALALGACRSGNAGTTDAGVLPPPSALTCEALVAPEVRDSLPGFTLKEERTCPTCGPLCIFRSAEQKDVTVSISYDCRKRFEGEDVRALLTPALNAGGVEVPALGKAAARREPVPGMLQVSAWDDDTPCGIVVTWLGKDKERALDIARMTLFATTPERLIQAGTHPAPPSSNGSPVGATPNAGLGPDAGVP